MELTLVTITILASVSVVSFALGASTLFCFLTIHGRDLVEVSEDIECEVYRDHP